VGQSAALYCRVSTADQSCARQERDLTAFAARAGYKVSGVFKETGSGAKLDRAERKKVIALAQRREIDAVLVTELSRWGPRYFGCSSRPTTPSEISALRRIGWGSRGSPHCSEEKGIEMPDGAAANFRCLPSSSR
jgi:Resolvase, N terminal domain